MMNLINRIEIVPLQNKHFFFSLNIFRAISITDNKYNYYAAGSLLMKSENRNVYEWFFVERTLDVRLLRFINRCSLYFEKGGKKKRSMNKKMCMKFRCVNTWKCIAPKTTLIIRDRRVNQTKQEAQNMSDVYR